MKRSGKSSLVITDELLMAYADGELAEGLAHQVGRAVDNDAALAARLKIFRLTGRALGPHFDDVLDAQPPAAMLQAIRSAPISRMAADSAPTIGQSIRSLLQGWGLGASPWPALAGVAAGLLIGVMSTGLLGGSALLTEENGKLVAAGALERTLESETTQASYGAAIQVMATFKDSTGRWCRLYQGPEHAGLACRAADERQWQVLAAGEGTIGAEGSYGTSEGGGARAVDDLASAMQESSAAMEPDAEAALIARQWKE